MTDIQHNEPALVPVTNRAPVRPDSPTFAELGVRAETVEALAKAGINRAFAIQEYALPIAMRGTDLIGQAPTGTGKTLGFGLPILERLIDQMAPHYRNAPRELYDDASWVGFRLTELLPLAPDEAQHMLELTDPARRLAELRDILPRFQRD